MKSTEKVLLKKANVGIRSSEVDEAQIMNDYSFDKELADALLNFQAEKLVIKNGHFKDFLLIPSAVFEDTFILGHDEHGYKINDHEYRKSIEIFRPKENLREFDLQVAYEILIDFFKSYVEGLKRSKPLVGEYSLAAHEQFFRLPNNIFDIHSANSSAKKIAQDLLEQSIDKLKKDFPNLTKEQIKIIKNTARGELSELFKAKGLHPATFGE